MGFFKSVRDLQKQSKEIQKEFDVGQTMADAKTRMAAGLDMMARQTEAANKAVRAQSMGVEVPVTITGMRQVGMINFDAMIEFELTAMPDGRPPYPVTAQQAVPQIQLGMLRPGASLSAKVDPSDPSAIWLDLTTVT